MWLGPGILLCRSLVSLGLIQVVIDVWGLGKVWLNTFEKVFGVYCTKTGEYRTTIPKLYTLKPKCPNSEP